MITRIPTKEYSLRPSIRDICLNYGLINSSTWSLGHLAKFYSNILDKIGSTRVSLRTSATDTGKDSNCTRLICWISSFSWRTWSFNSNLDKQSAFACLFGDLYSISFWQPDNSHQLSSVSNLNGNSSLKRVKTGALDNFCFRWSKAVGFFWCHLPFTSPSSNSLGG